MGMATDFLQCTCLHPTIAMKLRKLCCLRKGYSELRKWMDQSWMPPLVSIPTERKPFGEYSTSAGLYPSHPWMDGS